MKTLSLAVTLGLVGLLLVGCSGNDPKAASTPQPSTAERSGSPLQASPTFARPTQRALATVGSPAPSPTVQLATPIVGDVNLTGSVTSDIPGTLIAVGATITSVVDEDTKPRDVYAISLMAGDVYQIEFTIDSNVIDVVIANPESKSFDYDRFTGLDFCYYCSSDDRQFAPAVSGIYYLSVSTTWPAIQYTLHIVAL